MVVKLLPCLSLLACDFYRNACLYESRFFPDLITFFLSSRSKLVLHSLSCSILPWVLTTQFLTSAEEEEMPHLNQQNLLITAQ